MTSEKENIDTTIMKKPLNSIPLLKNLTIADSRTDAVPLVQLSDKRDSEANDLNCKGIVTLTARKS